jgi:hypothetical protein
MIQESQFKILRLNTGEDIVGVCTLDEENNCIGIEKPMKIKIMRIPEQSNKTILLMMPWLPVEIIQENFAVINYEDIITMIDPHTSFIEYYNSTVIEYEERLSVDEDSMFNEYDEEEQEVEEVTDKMKLH